MNNNAVPDNRCMKGLHHCWACERMWVHLEGEGPRPDVCRVGQRCQVLRSEYCVGVLTCYGPSQKIIHAACIGCVRAP